MATKYRTATELAFQSGDIPIQTWRDLWVVRYGDGWVRLTEEMLIDATGVLGQMTTALAQANMLEQHYITNQMIFVAKLREGA